MVNFVSLSPGLFTTADPTDSRLTDLIDVLKDDVSSDLNRLSDLAKLLGLGPNRQEKCCVVATIDAVAPIGVSLTLDPNLPMSKYKCASSYPMMRTRIRSCTNTPRLQQSLTQILP